MDYQVWIKTDYEEQYTKVDCGDLPAAKRELDKAVRKGQEPILTLEVPYELSIKTGEAGSEVKKGKPKHNKVAGPEGEGEPGSGADEPVPEQH